MVGTTAEPADTVVERYFAAVSDALRGLPPERRADILADLRAHLDARRQESRDGRGADIQALLRELGAPAEIAAQAGVEAADTPRERGTPDGWATASIVLTVLVWPLGIVVAALSGRWSLRALVYAGATPLIGWMVGGLGGLSVLAVALPQVVGTACTESLPSPGVGLPATCLGGPGTTLPTHLHVAHWMSVAAGAGGATALITALAVTPMVASIYLVQTLRRPEARPYVPATALGLVALGLVVAAVLGPRAAL